LDILFGSNKKQRRTAFMETLVSLLPFIIIIAIFYFLLIRPENKKKKVVAEMRANLKVGEEVMTLGGVVGRICGIDGDLITIETGEDRVRIQFDRAAISNTGMQMLQNGGKKKKAQAEETPAEVEETTEENTEE